LNPALARSAGGSPLFVQLLAFETDPFGIVVGLGAECRGHHRHATARANRRPVVLVHEREYSGRRGRTLESVPVRNGR
jgi:hypothetical protein